MHLPDEIQKLIDETKTQKNNLQRNKIISHLEDALAHAKVQASWVPPSLAESAPAPTQSQECICPLGALDRDCPVHGS